jgi:glyoxylate/hydroxypyruvate reductase
MADYARYGVLHHMRRFEAYRQQAARGEWRALDAMHRRDMPIGVLGLGDGHTGHLRCNIDRRFRAASR